VRSRGEISGEKPSSWYDAEYAKADPLHTVHYTRSLYYFLWSVIVDRMPEAASVLEIGCGTGQLAELLGDRDVRQYVGFDFSAAAVKMARQRSPHLQFEVDDALTTRLLSSSGYDTLICTEVLEHIEADREVVRRVRPGVRCLITVPNFPHVSHVRQFAAPSDVSVRYGHFFTHARVTEFLSNVEGDRFFLLDGVRNGVVGACAQRTHVGMQAD
jgi:2-polyprenyl-3-methyl-5-hydroxy-6-metoxy-1,4-benzoquinol methylase